MRRNSPRRRSLRLPVFARALALALVALPSSGCATLLHGTSQQIRVSTEPAGAEVVLRCAGVENRLPEPTPTAIHLKRRGPACAVELSKPGYRPVTIELVKRVSALLALGNIVTCGCGLAVDAMTGAMFAFVPGSVEVTLGPSAEGPPPGARDDGEDVEP